MVTSPLANQKRALQMKKQKHPWYVHQSNAHTELKPCRFKGCPGRKPTENKTKNWPFRTCTRTEECVVLNERKHMHFCNTTNSESVRNCHSKYHQIKYPNPDNKRKNSNPKCYYHYIPFYLFKFIWVVTLVRSIDVEWWKSEQNQSKIIIFAYFDCWKICLFYVNLSTVKAHSLDLNQTDDLRIDFCDLTTGLSAI